MNPVAKFNWDDADKAAREWGANCGPGAIAAVLDKKIDEIRPFMGDFEKKHYTNPKLMLEILNKMGVKFWKPRAQTWPRNGLIRIQWEGPWTDLGVPLRKRYRHTHWVASRWIGIDIFIFDINCICVGGWVHVGEWEKKVVPWLLKEVEPKAYGTYYPTHILALQENFFDAIRGDPDMPDDDRNY